MATAKTNKDGAVVGKILTAKELAEAKKNRRKRLAEEAKKAAAK